MSWQEVSEVLKEIPHLKLPIPIPISDLKKEIFLGVDEYLPININLELRGQTGQNRPWFGRGIIDYRPNSKELYEYRALQKEWITLNSFGDVNVYKTELADQLPVTMSIVNSVSPYARVTRLLWIPGGAVLPWHSHCQSAFIGFTPYRKVIVQIPIETNEKVLYRVKKIGAPDSQSSDKCYLPGEAWIFNSWHEHQVENNSNQSRISLYIEAPLYDSHFLSLVKGAVKNEI